MFFLMSRSVTPEETKNIIDRKLKDARESKKVCSFEKLDDFEKKYLSEISDKEKIKIVEEKVKNSLFELMFKESVFLSIGLIFTYGFAKSLMSDNPQLTEILLDKKVIGLFASLMIVKFVTKIMKERYTIRYNVHFLDS